jgi:hypothetical protein
MTPAGAARAGAARGVELSDFCNAVCRYWTEDTDNARKFPLFISVDGNHQPTLSFAAALGPTTGIQVIQHMQSVTKCRYMGFCNLNMHYRFLLQVRHSLQGDRSWPSCRKLLY